jgi:hypothetical protein
VGRNSPGCCVIDRQLRQSVGVGEVDLVLIDQLLDLRLELDEVEPLVEPGRALGELASEFGERQEWVAGEDAEKLLRVLNWPRLDLVDVGDDLSPQDLGVCHVADVRRHLQQSGVLRSREAVEAVDQSVLVLAGRSDGDGVDDPLRTDRVHERDVLLRLLVHAPESDLVLLDLVEGNHLQDSVGLGHLPSSISKTQWYSESQDNRNVVPDQLSRATYSPFLSVAKSRIAKSNPFTFAVSSLNPTFHSGKVTVNFFLLTYQFFPFSYTFPCPLSFY